MKMKIFTVLAAVSALTFAGNSLASLDGTRTTPCSNGPFDTDAKCNITSVTPSNVLLGSFLWSDLVPEDEKTDELRVGSFLWSDLIPEDEKTDDLRVGSFLWSDLIPEDEKTDDLRISSFLWSD